MEIPPPPRLKIKKYIKYEKKRTYGVSGNGSLGMIDEANEDNILKLSYKVWGFEYKCQSFKKWVEGETVLCR